MQESDSNLKECKERTHAETRLEGAKPHEGLMREGGDAKDGRRLCCSRSPAAWMLLSLSGIFSSNCPRSSPPSPCGVQTAEARPRDPTAPQSTALHKDAFGWREPRLLTLNLPRWEEGKRRRRNEKKSPLSAGSLLLLVGLQG